jgi:hypothetical protein
MLRRGPGGSLGRWAAARRSGCDRRPGLVEPVSGPAIMTPQWTVSRAAGISAAERALIADPWLANPGSAVVRPVGRDT